MLGVRVGRGRVEGQVDVRDLFEQVREPALDVVMPASAARASPGESGSMPAMPTSSSASLRPTFAIRSLPMLPDPMITTRRRSATAVPPSSQALQALEPERLEQLGPAAGRDELAIAFPAGGASVTPCIASPVET